MAREATGELRHLADGYAAHITIEGRARRAFLLPTCSNESDARERCTALAKMAARLRRAGQTAADIEKLVGMAAKARAGRQWENVCDGIATICGGTSTKDERQIPTVEAFAGDWTTGRLHERFPDHVGKKKPSSVTRDEGILDKYVKPAIGELRVDEVALADCEMVMASVPATLSPSSRRQVAQFLAKLLGYAVYPCRYMTAVPVPRGWLPKIGKPKAMQCVRPAEDAAHLSNTTVPLWRRLYFGVDRREGLRVEELASLRWRDVDLELGAVRLDVNKTDVPRAWALSPDVAEALRRWKPEGAQPDDFVFIDETGHRIDVQHLARAQREDMFASGVTRPELHDDGPNRRKLRAHDARASFVTCALANGRSEAWVMDRTGHTTSAMLNRYRRSARTWGELGLGTWTPLHEAIPELRGDAMLRGSEVIAPRIATKNTIGAVAKWSGSGLQIRYTSVRIRSAPPGRRKAARGADRRSSGAGFAPSALALRRRIRSAAPRDTSRRGAESPSLRKAETKAADRSGCGGAGVACSSRHAVDGLDAFVRVPRGAVSGSERMRSALPHADDVRVSRDAGADAVGEAWREVASVVPEGAAAAEPYERVGRESARERIDRVGQRPARSDGLGIQPRAAHPHVAPAAVTPGLELADRGATPIRFGHRPRERFAPIRGGQHAIGAGETAMHRCAETPPSREAAGSVRRAVRSPLDPRDRERPGVGRVVHDQAHVSAV
jgi:integrase